MVIDKARVVVEGSSLVNYLLHTLAFLIMPGRRLGDVWRGGSAAAGGSAAHVPANKVAVLKVQASRGMIET